MLCVTQKWMLLQCHSHIHLHCKNFAVPLLTDKKHYLCWQGTELNLLVLPLETIYFWFKQQSTDHNNYMPERRPHYCHVYSHEMATNLKNRSLNTYSANYTFQHTSHVFYWHIESLKYIIKWHLTCSWFESQRVSFNRQQFIWLILL